MDEVGEALQHVRHRRMVETAMLSKVQRCVRRLFTDQLDVYPDGSDIPQMLHGVVILDQMKRPFLISDLAVFGRGEEFRLKGSAT